VLEHFPDDDLTIVVLTNTDGGTASPIMIATRIARLMLGLPDETVRDIAIPPSELAGYVGTFDSDEGGVETVASERRLGFRPPDRTSRSRFFVIREVPHSRLRRKAR